MYIFQAIETVREYDKATVGLESTVKETSELEKRANLAGVELIKASEKLNAIRREIKDSEGKRGKQERLLRDVTQVGPASESHGLRDHLHDVVKIIALA